MCAIMKIIEVEQRGEPWLAWRRTKVMASEMAAILGLSKWDSPYSIWLDKIGMGKPKEINDDMTRGIENEPKAIKLLEKRLGNGIEFKPLCVESPEYPFLGASLDGYYSDDNVKWIVEVKSPREAGYRASVQGMIPDNYMIQIQCQLLCTGADLCFYVTYFEGKINVIEVRPDPTAFEMIIEGSKKFWYDNVLAFESPNMTSKDYIERDDEEFQRLVLIYKMAQEKKKFAVDLEDRLRKQLIGLSREQNIRGFGLSVQHTVRRGNIDYSRIEALKGLNLDEYRKEPIKMTTIRIEKDG